MKLGPYTLPDSYTGDCRELLAQLPDESVQCVVTSPPYWGLRDYGSCSCGSGRFDLGQGEGTGGNLNYRAAQQFDPSCEKCQGTGRIVATETQLGLEQTPEQYVAAMADVFEQVRRVLRADGTLWLNLGDSYAAGKAGRTDDGTDSPSSTLGPNGTGLPNNTGAGVVIPRKPPPGLKPKDLVGIPWRVAFALQAAGWYLRSDIIWAKPNPMPESVTDRPTKSHEYLFLLTKSARYYYDADAVAEPLADANAQRTTTGYSTAERYGAGNGGNTGLDALCARMRDGSHTHRNKRSVWTVNGRPYSGAHFACFPPKLIEPCILAGSKPGDVVLDPFFGSGTTGQVAEKHGRLWLGFDINPEYKRLQDERTSQRSLPGVNS